MPRSTFSTTLAHRGARSRRAARVRERGARRGFLSLALVAAIVLGLMIGALVLNWAWLVLVARDMQAKADALALAAAPALLDDDLLRDAAGPPAPNPEEDAAAAEAAARDLLDRLNQVAPHGLRLRADDLEIEAGHVGDIAAGQAFRHALGPLGYSASRVTLARVDHQGLAGMFGDRWALLPPRVATKATAALDQYVIGFRPSEGTPAPLLPLAVSADAWEREPRNDSDGDGIRNLELRLPSPDPVQEAAAPANATLIGYNDALVLDAVISQISQGVRRTDLASGAPLVGPATPGNCHEVAARPNTATPGGDEPLAIALQSLVGTRRARRALAVFDPAHSISHRAALCGFVAVRILRAEVDGARLVVIVEPCFLSDPSLETASPSDPLGPSPNLYLYKLRLAR